METSVRTIALLILCFMVAIAGCGPSESDIQEALAANRERVVKCILTPDQFDEFENCLRKGYSIDWVAEQVIMVESMRLDAYTDQEPKNGDLIEEEIPDHVVTNALHLLELHGLERAMSHYESNMKKIGYEADERTLEFARDFFESSAY